MAVRADFSVGIEIVEQDEVADELVMVGGDLFGKQAKARVAIALREIAEP